MSHYRAHGYPPRKRQRGDYYDTGYNRPRQTPEESILTRLRKDFISLADPRPNGTAADDVDYVAKSIVSDYSKADSVKTGIHELVYNCVLELPPKIPYFASLFAVANARKQVIGKDILDFTIAKVKELLEEGDLTKAKLMLRFLAGLTRIVDDDGVMLVIGEIVSEIERHEPNARMDNLANVVLLTLPYIAASPKKLNAALDSVVDRLTTYMDSRDTNETSFIKPFKSAHPDPLADYSSLHLLWLQIKSLKESEWDIPFLPRPWFAFRTELESNTKTHPLPEFTLVLNTTSLQPLEPEYYFSVFLGNEKHTVPVLTSIASTLLRDLINDTICQLVFNRKECSRLLIDLHHFFPTGLFHRAGISVKDLPSPQGARPKYKLEDLLVDAIFAQLFRLPSPREREVCYAALLTEVTKLAPQDVAPTLGRAIRWIYDRIDGIVGEVNMRFSTWFAVHLSNFGFTYKWEEWIGDIELEDGSPKKVFLRDTIEKEIRLSYIQRIQQSMPEEYHSIFPKTPLFEEWKPIADSFNAEEGSEKLVEAMRTRDEAAVASYVESNPDCGALMIAAILFASHETPYSHVIPPTTLELVKKNSPASVIETVMSFWKERPSTGTVLVMKYADLGVITLGDVVSWLLEQDGWMHKSWGWEIMEICLHRTDVCGQQSSQTDEISHNENNADPSDTAEQVMHVDTNNGEANGTQVNVERRALLEKIISCISICYGRQGELDKNWTKEWFGMIVRKCSMDLAETEATGWVGEMLTEAKEYQRRLA